MKKIGLLVIAVSICLPFPSAKAADTLVSVPADNLHMIEAEMNIGIEKASLLIDFHDSEVFGDEVSWQVTNRPFFSEADENSFHKDSAGSPVYSNTTFFTPDAAGKYVLTGIYGESREKIEISLSVYKKKSLVVILDGVRADALLNSGAEHLEQLMQDLWQEDYGTAYSLKARTDPDAHPNSGANHASIMTGVTAKKHGVFTNVMYKEDAADIESYPHYLDILEQENPEIKTAFLVSWWADYTMIQSSDYQRKGKGGYGRSSIVEDELITEYAKSMLSGEPAIIPGSDGTEWTGGDIDALFLFYDSPDAGGHGFELDILGPVGFYPYSTNYLEMIRICDEYIKSCMEIISRRPDFAYEEWQFVFTTDHGGFGTSHGYYNAGCMSIWFMHTAKNLAPGELIGVPHNYDLTVTVLQHFGLDTEKMKQDGKLDGTAQFLVKPRNSQQYPTPLPEALDEGEMLPVKFDADGFTVIMEYNHPWYDVFRFQHPIFSVPLDQEPEEFKFGIFTDYEFWTGIGGRWGDRDGTITYDDRDSDQNRSLGVTAAWGSDPIDFYSLVPQSGRDTFIGFTVDGEGNAILYSDRSDGYLYFVAGSLASPDSPFGTESVLNMSAGEFVSDMYYWDREISPQEMITYYRGRPEQR